MDNDNGKALDLGGWLENPWADKVGRIAWRAIWVLIVIGVVTISAGIVSMFAGHLVP